MASGERALQPAALPSLAPLTTVGVGGAARWYVQARSIPEVAAAHHWASARGLPLFVLGGGSNVLIVGDTYEGLVLHVAIEGIELRESGHEALIEAGAGESWDGLVARIVDKGYAGMECLSGIPGSVGGTPIQNVGAYGQEVADTIESVTAFDSQTREVVTLPTAACGFSYRQSRFKAADAGRFIVCAVAFRLHRGAPTVTYPDVVAWVERQGKRNPDVADIRTGVLAIRRQKGMALDPADPDTRSVGSFFMNPVVTEEERARLGAPGFSMPDGLVKIPAAWLIERAGFSKGFTKGRAAISSKHPLAIVNRGGATADDILDLACHIKTAVLDRLGVALRPEPVFVGGARDARVRFLQEEHD